MNQPLYHVEDLETLLLQKEFHELLEDEKSFVLQHISDQREYDQMRALLYKLIEESQEDEHWLEPDPKVKIHLDRLFEEPSKETPIVPFYQKGLFWSLSGVAALFVVALFFFWPTPQDELALAQLESNNAGMTPPPVIGPPSEVKDPAESNDLKPTPPMVEQISFTPLEVNEEEVSDAAPTLSESNGVAHLDAEDAPLSHASQQEPQQMDKKENTISHPSNIILPSQYSKGEEALKKDASAAVQRALQKMKWSREEGAFNVYVQLIINSQGVVQSIQFLRGAENQAELRRALRQELMQMNRFDVPAVQDPSALFLLNLPLSIDLL